jgi:hypothetical protein
MLAHPWRGAVFPRSGKWFRHVLSPAIETAATMAILIGLATSLVRAENITTPTDPVDTEHMFGFVEGADIGDKGEKGIRDRLDLARW